MSIQNVKRFLLSFILCLLLGSALVSTSFAGIVAVNYGENSDTFYLDLTGDAIDSTVTNTFTFGHDWLINLLVSEINGDVDQLSILGTAVHLVPTIGQVFDSGEASVRGDGTGYPLNGVGWAAHNATNTLSFVLPYDFYGIGLNYATSNVIALPPPELKRNQITQWSYRIYGSHVPEPSTTILISLGICLFFFRLCGQKQIRSGRNNALNNIDLK